MVEQPETDTRKPRRKVLRACEPCKQRKKRCDGTQPCATCIRYQYDCYFSSQARARLQRGTRRASIPSHSILVSTAGVSDTTAPRQARATDRVRPAGRSREATSRAAMSYASLSTAVEDQLREPQVYGRFEHRAQSAQPVASTTFSAIHHVPATHSLTVALSLDRMQQLTANYVNYIHPVYDFIRPIGVREAVTARFTSTSGCWAHDTILFGIAALGTLYSDEPAAIKESSHHTLSQSFQTSLDADMTRSSTPNLELVAALLLKTLYLRSSARPYATWMASCTTMQTIIMMEREVTNLSREETLRDSCYDPQQTLWIARLLNTWIANEFGRRSIKTPFDDLIVPPWPEDPIFAAPAGQKVYLWRISDSLCPENEGDMVVFEECVTKLAVLDPRHCHDGVLLSRAVLAFCFHRLVRSNGPTALARQIFTSLVEIGLDGLQAARRLALQQKPWWHLANAPFQFLCSMLVIDTSSSFAQIPKALQAFEDIAQAIPSLRITEALGIVKKLVDLSKQQKIEQLQHLDSDFSPVHHQFAPTGLGGLAGSDFQTRALPPESAFPQQMFDVESFDTFGSIDWSFLSNMGIPLLEEDLNGF